MDLVGILAFPNLQLETNVINFGSILNETSKKIIITMKNISEMPLNYEWNFVEDQINGENVGGEDTKKMSRRKSIKDGEENAVENFPINEVFDILPLNGNLLPDEVENIEFIFNAVSGQRFKTQAICKIDGGPDYEVQIIGDASLINHKIHLQNATIDLGEVRFCEWAAKEFIVENVGKVTFQYQIALDSRKAFVEVSPLQGKIAGGEKQKFTVRLCPVMPDAIREQFSI